MAKYDAHGYDGYGIRQPPYVVGYSATSESYVTSTEQVVQLGGYMPTHAQVWPPTLTRVPLKKGGDTYEYDKFNQVRGGEPWGSPHGSPRKTRHSPPQGHYSSMYGNNHMRRIDDGDSSSDDDEDVECRNGVCYPKPKHAGEKKKTNGYGGSMQPTDHHHHHQPRVDPHHQTPDPRNNNYGRNPYAHAKPVTDAYYDRFSYPANEPRSNNITVPAPIKTRPDHPRDAKNSPASVVTHWTPLSESPRKDYLGKQDFIDNTEKNRNSPPQSGHNNFTSSPISAATHKTPFSGSPRKDYQGKQEFIDSAEAQRRYANQPPQSGQNYKNKPAIDCKTAAERYGGVFVK